MSEETKRCPYCDEEILLAARKCKHCGEILDEDLRRQRQNSQQPQSPPQQQMVRTWSPGAAAVLSLFIPGAGQLYKGQIGIGLVWLICTVIGYVLFIVPGIILHIACIVNAYNGQPKMD